MRTISADVAQSATASRVQEGAFTLCGSLHTELADPSVCQLFFVSNF